MSELRADTRSLSKALARAKRIIARFGRRAKSTPPYIGPDGRCRCCACCEHITQEAQCCVCGHPEGPQERKEYTFMSFTCDHFERAG